MNDLEVIRARASDAVTSGNAGQMNGVIRHYFLPLCDEVEQLRAENKSVSETLERHQCTSDYSVGRLHADDLYGDEIVRLRAENAASKAEMSEAKEVGHELWRACVKAASIFPHYADMHRAKDTDKAGAKALANTQHANELLAVTKKVHPAQVLCSLKIPNPTSSLARHASGAVK